MKKMISLMLVMLMTAMLFAGCGSSSEAATPTGFSENYKIAIVQQLDHSSLNEIRDAAAQK